MRCSCYFAEIVGVTSMLITIDHFIVANPVFVTHCKIATQLKIPAQESIYIEEIYIFIKAVNKCAGHRFTIFIYSGETIIRYFAPVMSHPEIEIQPWRK